MVEIASFVLDVVKCLAAPIGRPFMYLYNYKKNIDNLQDEVKNLKNTRDEVQVKVEVAELNGEEIKQRVKEWQTKVNNTITEAERLIEEKEENARCFKGLRPNCINRYKHSKKAFKLKPDDIGPLLLQEERFGEVFDSCIQQSKYEKNFVKFRDDVLKLKNARRKVQHKVEEAKINGEEIEEDVKKWLEDVDSVIVKAEELIENQSSIGTDWQTRYQNSKAASELMVDDIGPLLQQEEKFDRVSYPTIPLEKNFDKLRDDVSKLKNARLKVQRKVEVAEKNVEEIEEDVKKWLEEVDSIIIKGGELIENQSSIGTDWQTRYQYSKAASELMVDDIGPLLQQEERFEKVSHPTIHKEIWLRSDEDYLVFESRNSTEKNVWEALKDENIYMIGVYGMGGLGKTTLVQEIGRNAENNKLFNEIVFVEVTETPDTTKIQTAIAKKLGLRFEDEKEDESERASKLYSRMMKKNILLILDNIWKDLELKTVGIPSGTDRGRSKILMTTRNVDALDKMGSTNNFGIGILNEKEAWSLFKKMTGGEIPTCELNSLPQDVCKECGGLPIVICTIAKALKSKCRPSDWKVALRELKAPSPTKFTGLLEKEYMKIALSYKYLRDDELKKTFLLSSLMKNNTSISDFFIHVVGLDILEGANLKMKEARDRLDTLVRDLKDSCLLIDGFTSEEFAMHDVVRAVAITISYTDHHVFTGRNDVERHWKDKDKLKKCTKISLTNSSTVISELWPNDLDCPNLEYFYMATIWGFHSSFEIPEDFFTVMPKLKVFILYRIQQSMLPLSLDLLINLQTLCLSGSNIKDVAIIGKLKKLKVLSLPNSFINELPKELGQLTQLRLLDLSNCRQLKVIVPNVISNLLQLEEFHVKGCPIEWKVEVLEELKLLSQLASLELDIKDNKMLPKDFFSKELETYKISIGHWFKRYIGDNEDEGLRMFELKLNSTISLEELRGIRNVELLRLADFSDVENSFNDFVTLTPLLNEKVIFTNLMALELNNISCGKIWDSKFPALMSSSYKNLTRFILKSCGKIKYVFPSSVARSLQTLRSLEIRDCEVLEEIVAQEGGAEAVVNFPFPLVTYLKLKNLPKLIVFYPGIHTCEWPMLKKLVINKCGKFTSKCLSFQENSFHISEPKSLCLEHKINSNLEYLHLKDGLRQIRWQSRFKTLEIEYDESANIPFGLIQRFENLEFLQLAWCGYEEMFSCGKDEKHMQITLGPSLVFFQNLKFLNVSQCRELTKLMTPLTARSLVHLRELSIEGCEMVIEIVENEGDATTSTEIVFENLKKLLLRRLETLICFCSGNYSFNYPSLEELIIGECPNMKTFSQGILSTPKLHKVNYVSFDEIYETWVKIKEVKNEGNDLNKSIQGAYKKQDISLDLKYKTFKDVNSTEICYNQHPNFFYQNLTHLFLWNCGNIKYAFPSSIAQSLHQLQQLKIENCEVLEEIVANEEEANAVINFVFPNITLLKLQKLPKLTTFYLGIHTSKWPMLKELVVINCEKFISKHMSFQENGEEGELHIFEPKSLFLDDKINHDLEVFNITNDWKEIIWNSQSKALEIEYDDSIDFPLGLLQRFENLKKLQLYHCDQFQELFFPNLEVLDLLSCSKLTSLVPSSASFQNLEVMTVHDCNGFMMKLITPSTAKNLVHLREMSIKHCYLLIEIVENEGEGDTTMSTEIVFDNLKKLSLVCLDSLTCFCSGNYSFNFPSLEELNIKFCPNIKTFSQGISNTPKLHKVIYVSSSDTITREETEVENRGNGLNTNIQQAHKKEVDSNLKELTLSGSDIMSIRKGEFQESFGKVKTLRLINDAYANIPIQILPKLNSLENLILKMSSYEEIFLFEEDKEHIETLTKLKNLELFGLLDLKCIWKQDSRLNSILQNLDSLEVKYCHKLTTMLPSLASFENLRILKVSYCNEMQNLMSSSTAKSLVRLEYLSIESCEMMIEILANEGDIEKGEIVFEKLKQVQLKNLESLTCFYCSRDYTLKFPNLEILYVSECSKMKTFSGGGLSMPRLKILNTQDCSFYDIDSIIEQLQNDCSDFCERFEEEEEEEKEEEEEDDDEEY